MRCPFQFLSLHGKLGLDQRFMWQATWAVACLGAVSMGCSPTHDDSGGDKAVERHNPMLVYGGKPLRWEHDNDCDGTPNYCYSFEWGGDDSTDTIKRLEDEGCDGIDVKLHCYRFLYDSHGRAIRGEVDLGCDGSYDYSEYCASYEYDNAGRVVHAQNDWWCAGAGYGSCTTYTYSSVERAAFQTDDMCDGTVDRCGVVTVVPGADIDVFDTTWWLEMSVDEGCDGNPSCVVQKFDGHGNLVEFQPDATCDGPDSDRRECWKYDFDKLGRVEAVRYDYQCVGSAWRCETLFY